MEKNVVVMEKKPVYVFIICQSATQIAWRKIQFKMEKNPVCFAGAILRPFRIYAYKLR